MDQELVKNLIRQINRLSREQDQLNVNEIRLVLALERAVARLQYDQNLSDYLLFKGGFVLYKKYESSRFTRDVDALASGISKEHLQKLTVKALEQDIKDGFWYGDIHVQELTEQGEYGSCRFDMAFQIGLPDLKKIHKLPRIHVDIGFSDHLVASAKNEKLISILTDVSPISWRIYPLEQIIAEKLQTLIARGSANSRAKDVYDLAYLLPLVESESLMASIKNTFEYRQTPLPKSFYDTVGQIDLNQLQHAWSSVKLVRSDEDFEEVWQKLLKCVKVLDQ